MVADLNMVLEFSDKLDMVVHTNAASTQEVETGGSGGICCLKPFLSKLKTEKIQT